MNELKIGRNAQGVKTLAFGLSLLVYASFVIYSEWHFYNLISEFVPSDFSVIGLVAVAASAFTAIGLPIALHYWFRSGLQKIMGYVFYGFHFAIVVINLILDGALISDGEVPPFIENVYGVYVLPGYIAFYGLAWSVLWFLDEQSKRLEKRIEMEETEEDGVIGRRVVVAEAKNAAIAQAFKSEGAQRAVNRWAARNAPKLLAAELGISVDELGGDDEYVFWEDEEESAAPPTLPTGGFHLLRFMRNGLAESLSFHGRDSLTAARLRATDLALEGCVDIYVTNQANEKVWPKNGMLNRAQPQGENGRPPN